MNTYRITCREYAYFVKEVKANSKDEAREKLHANVNSFKTTMEWDEEWEIADIETKEEAESLVAQEDPRIADHYEEELYDIEQVFRFTEQKEVEV